MNADADKKLREAAQKAHSAYMDARYVPSEASPGVWKEVLDAMAAELDRILGYSELCAKLAEAQRLLQFSKDAAEQAVEREGKLTQALRNPKCLHGLPLNMSCDECSRNSLGTNQREWFINADGSPANAEADALLGGK